MVEMVEDSGVVDDLPLYTNLRGNRNGEADSHVASGVGVEQILNKLLSLGYFARRHRR